MTHRVTVSTVLMWCGIMAFECLASDAPSPAEFFKNAAGLYEIVSVNPEPKQPEGLGEVSVDDAEFVFTFPYCPPWGNACDPGYIFLSRDKTEIHREVAPDQTSYYVFEPSLGDIGPLEWHEKADGTVVFVRHHYPKPDGTFVDLSFVLKRAGSVR